MTLTDDVLLEAEAVNRLICTMTGRVVGIEYRWNTGEMATLWVDKPSDSTERSPINAKALSDE